MMVSMILVFFCLVFGVGVVVFVLFFWVGFFVIGKVIFFGVV